MKVGTKVRRKRDKQLYTTGEVSKGGVVGSVYHEGEVIRLYPVWDGRAHSKTMVRFLAEYEVEPEHK